MKKFKSLSIVATVVVLGLAAVIGGYIYTTTDGYQAQKLYDELGNDYAASQCDSITKRFPATKYAELAQEKKRTLLRQQAEWNTISKNPSRQAIQTFKSKHQLTDKYFIAAEEKLDSLLWDDALKLKTKKNYEEYAQLGQMARNYDEAMFVLQKMNQIPEVAAVSQNLEEQVNKFFDALGKGDATAVSALCADTVSFFLFRQNLTADKVAEFINKTYCKNIKKRTFSAPSAITFDKSRIAVDKAGYIAHFTIDLTAPAKVARKQKALFMFTPEGKIIYASMRPCFRK